MWSLLISADSQRGVIGNKSAKCYIRFVAFCRFFYFIEYAVSFLMSADPKRGAIKQSTFTLNLKIATTSGGLQGRVQKS